MDGQVPLAGEIGLDTSDFRDCLESSKYASHVQEDFDDGVRIGITGTPGNVLSNNRTRTPRVRAGAIPYAQLKTDIDQLFASD